MNVHRQSSSNPRLGQAVVVPVAGEERIITKQHGSRGTPFTMAPHPILPQRTWGLHIKSSERSSEKIPSLSFPHGALLALVFRPRIYLFLSICLGCESLSQNRVLWKLFVRRSSQWIQLLNTQNSLFN